MRILVQKFGGTSVATAERLRKVMGKVRKALDKGYKVCAVLSARAGDTNSLIKLAHDYSPKPDKAELDVLMATGEQMSIALFSMMLKDAGIKARSVLAHQVPIRTESAYGRARILEIDDSVMRKMFEEYDVLVAAGFQGVDEFGRITTLGRGGSDTSGVAIAAALKAEACEIYTDVDGVYTTDPNMCPQARKMPRVAFDEMLEMASMGAKVLHIRSVELAKKYNVPLYVLSTFTDDPGTIVCQEDENMEALSVSSVAYDKDQARVTLHQVYDEPGVAAKIFESIAKAKIVVDMIIQNTSQEGRTDFTFTVPKGDLDNVKQLIGSIGTEIGCDHVSTEDKISKVSVIGVGMRNHSGVASKMFTALSNENINIILISTSEIKISCLIDAKYTELAVRALHEAFGLDKPIAIS